MVENVKYRIKKGGNNEQLTKWLEEEMNCVHYYGSINELERI